MQDTAQCHARDTEPLGGLSDSETKLCEYVLSENLAGVYRVMHHVCYSSQ